MSDGRHTIFAEFMQHPDRNLIVAPNFVQLQDVCRGYSINARMQIYLRDISDLRGHSVRKTVYVYRGSGLDKTRLELLEFARSYGMKVVYI